MEPDTLQAYLQSPTAKRTPVFQLGLSIKAGAAVRRLGVETVADLAPLMPLENLRPGKLGMKARRETQQKLERAAAAWAARPSLDAERQKLRDRVAEACFAALLHEAEDNAKAAFQAFEAAEVFLNERDRRHGEERPPQPETRPQP